MKYLYTALLVILFSCARQQTVNYIEYVDVLIGTGPSNTPLIKSLNLGQLPNGLTIPAVTAPFGMTQWTPELHNRQSNCLSPFYYRGTILQGFRATHWLNGTCTEDYASFGIFPTNRSREFRYLPDQRNAMYMLNPEKLSPSYAATLLSEIGIMSEMTATSRCGFFRFSWLDPKDATLIFDINNDRSEGYIKIDTARQEVYGYNPVYGSEEGSSSILKGYFVARFDKNIASFGTYGNNTYEDGNSECRDQQTMGAYVVFSIGENENLKLKVGTSFTSIDNARLNLETEIGNLDFDETKTRLDANWNNLLGRIEVETDNRDELTKFYTALYHSLLQPRLYSDVNGDYPVPGTSSIANSPDFDMYGDFANPAIYKSQLPLLSLIAPAIYKNMIQSLLVTSESLGRVPNFLFRNENLPADPGDFGSVVLADAVMKGFAENPELTYSLIRKNAFEQPDTAETGKGLGRDGLETWLDFGYLPVNPAGSTDNENHALSASLYYAYADWCLAQVAKKLGKEQDYKELVTRSYNYTNVFDEQTGEPAPRMADGSFSDNSSTDNEQVNPIFDPVLADWFVLFDIPGLIEIKGGKDITEKKLDRQLEGKAGQRALGLNQHIPYFYNDLGLWNKTQQSVKKLLHEAYSIGPGGLSVRDNAGLLSSWYVLNAMGFYPVCPGSNEYQLSSPVFRKVTLHLDKKYYPGGKLVLKTEGDAWSGVFEKVSLNGKEIGTALRLEDMQKGGTLLFSK